MLGGGIICKMYFCMESGCHWKLYQEAKLCENKSSTAQWFRLLEVSREENMESKNSSESAFGNFIWNK